MSTLAKKRHLLIRIMKCDQQLFIEIPAPVRLSVKFPGARASPWSQRSLIYHQKDREERTGLLTLSQPSLSLHQQLPAPEMWLSVGGHNQFPCSIFHRIWLITGGLISIYYNDPMICIIAHHSHSQHWAEYSECSQCLSSRKWGPWLVMSLIDRRSLIGSRWQHRDRGMTSVQINLLSPAVLGEGWIMQAFNLFQFCPVLVPLKGISSTL